MAKQKSPKSKSQKHPAAPQPGIFHEFSTVGGKGYTKRTELRMNIDAPPNYSEDFKKVDIVSGTTPAFAWYATAFEWFVASPERFISEVEKWAKEVLQRAGAPPEAIEANQLSLPDLVERDGFQRGQAVEWHAASVLKLIRLLHANTAELYESDPGLRYVVQAVMISAIQLGAFLREAEIRFDIAASQARKGGAHEKHIPAGVKKLVSSLLRKNRTATTPELWKMIPNDDMNALKIDGLKIYTQHDQLRFLMKGADGNWGYDVHSLSLTSFRRYVTAARKALAR